jgi:hypothetical protein
MLSECMSLLAGNILQVRNHYIFPSATCSSSLFLPDKWHCQAGLLLLKRKYDSIRLKSFELAKERKAISH